MMGVDLTRRPLCTLYYARDHAFCEYRIAHTFWRPPRCDPSGGFSREAQNGRETVSPDLTRPPTQDKVRVLCALKWPACFRLMACGLLPTLRATLPALLGPVGRPRPPKTWTHLKDMCVL